MKNKFVKFFISLIILLIIGYSIDISLVNAFSSISHYYILILASLIPLFINPIISSNRWRLFLKVQGINESFISLMNINFKSVFLGILMPSSTGFDAVRIYLIEKRNKNKIGYGGASVIVERLLGLYILSLIGIFGSIFVIKHGVSINLFYCVLIVNILITVIFYFFKSKYLYNKGIFLLSNIKSFNRLTNYLSLLYTSINNFPYRRVIISSIPLILMFQVSTIICGFLIFKAFDIEIPFYFHLSFMPLISIFSIIPISISGLGLREGAFIYLYGLLGLNSSICFLISLIYYFILMIIPALIGMVLYIFDSNHSFTLAKKDSI